MNRLTLTLIVLTLNLLATGLMAQEPPQKSWKKLMKEAEEFEKLGDLYRAAQYYESAYAQKIDKKDLMYHAGKCYLETRDYANAAKCLELVKEEHTNTNYIQPGFKYARALKQTGQYEEAKDAFTKFINAYNGADKEKMREIVDTEIQGCNFALKAQEYTNANITVQHLDPNVNTDRTEFAPIPFNDDVLYFSSTVSGVSKIYRTQKNKAGNWMTRQVPTIFTGKMEKPHFGNGSFTPDGKRFFFTQCDLVEGGKPKCQIYIMNEEAGKWSAPVKLPDYINAEGANTTHPYVTLVEDKEVLYFSSDREGGKGGLDLWYCTRDINSTGNNFTLPKNLGHNINTPGDEISPHYHVPSQVLYFSSNGRISAGGFDVFKSSGEKMKWDAAQNMGFPINSSADDLYFVVSEAHGGGYLISNRIYGNDKVATINDDVFYYGEEKKQLLVRGSVYSEKDASKAPLKDVNIKIFEVVDGNEELLQDRMFAVANEYKFVLEANKDFVMEVNAGGFQTFTTNISTKGIEAQETRIKDIVMRLPEDAVRVDPRHIVVPAKHNSEGLAYQLPEVAPTNPKTGSPYAEETDVYKAFVDAEAVAEKSDNRFVYWKDGELTPYNKEVVAINNPTIVEEPKIDPRFVVVPEKYNSEDNTYTLPKIVPNDPKTGKPYAAGTAVNGAYLAAKKVADAADAGKVYWNNNELTAYKAPIAVVVPKETPKEPNINKVYKDEETSAAPKGTAYKIQVAAVRKFRDYKYGELQDGELKSYKLIFEPIEGEITRVLIVPKDKNEDGSEGFKSKAAALNVLLYVVDHTRFKTAFVGKYEEDKRVGGSIRGLDEEDAGTDN